MTWLLVLGHQRWAEWSLVYQCLAHTFSLGFDRVPKDTLVVIYMCV